MNARTLEITADGGVMRITLDRPEQGNALSPCMVRDLDAALDLAFREQVRALVFEGRGRHFCTGFDLSDLANETDDSLLARFTRIELLLQRIWRAPFLTAAITSGRAIGAGADLFATCRLRFTGPAASFAFPGARGFGLVLGTRRLATLVGDANARDWIHFGTTIPADVALHAGLASHLFDDQGEINEVMAQHMQTPAGITASLRTALEPDARGHDANDLDLLVRSAAAPGLRERIAAYLGALKQGR